MARLTGWATTAGMEVGQVVAEVGSGLTGERPKLARVLSDRMIVAMRACRQAARVAELTGGGQLAGKPKPVETLTLSRYVDGGPDFETHRDAVESVSVLFELYDGTPPGMGQPVRGVSHCPPAGR